MSKTNSENIQTGGLTLAVLGCGNMGLAILSGIFASLSESTSGQSNSSVPSRLPSDFIACVRSKGSQEKIEKTLGEYKPKIKVVLNDNVNACNAADIVILGCKPYMVNEILSVDGMMAALEGKLLISVCAGVPVQQMEDILYGDYKDEGDGRQRCKLVRALPNTASAIRDSMTVVATSSPPLPEETASLVTWIFERIGQVTYLSPNLMDVSTALCGSGGAFFSLMLEAAVDGAVAMGLPRVDALKMAATTMRGTASLILNGEHPAVLREKVSSPGGCTIGGLLVLEEGSVRGTVAKAIREATCVASQLGAGVKNVNGTKR